VCIAKTNVVRDKMEPNGISQMKEEGKWVGVMMMKPCRMRTKVREEMEKRLNR